MVILAIVIPVLVVLAGIVLFAASRRRDIGQVEGSLSRETKSRDRGAVDLNDEDAVVSGRSVEKAAVLARREASGDLVLAADRAPAVWTPPDPETVGVNRRQFFNRSIIGFMGFSLSGFGAASVAMLWPSAGGGFGSPINLGSVDALKTSIRDSNGFFYVPEGRMWVTEYPTGAIEKARAVYTAPELAGMESGIITLFQKCPHLGCRVPECGTSQWFECPCHGSQYNRVGEKRGGPAPRGMDRFAMSVSNGELTADTGAIIQGPPVGVNTTGQEAEGPNCIGQSTH